MLMIMLMIIFVCRAVFLQRRSRELLDNDELQVCVLYSWCICLILDATELLLLISNYAT